MDERDEVKLLPCGVDQQPPPDSSSSQSHSAEDSHRPTSPLEVERKRSCSGLFVLSGCFITTLLIIVGSVFGFAYMAYNAAKRPVEMVAQTMKNAAAETWRLGVEAVNKAPQSTYSVRYKFASSGGADRYVVAEIKENVVETFESVKWNIMSGSVTINSEALFEYYIPLAGYKYSVRNSRDEGKYDFEFIFEDLALNTPVKSEIKKMKVVQSRFSSDVNADIDRYISAEFPHALAERGTDFRNMRLASDIAAKSMEKYVRNTIFPLMGVRAEEVGKLSIIFDTRGVEKPSAQMKVGGAPSAPPITRSGFGEDDQ